MEQMSQIFKELGHPVRLTIIKEVIKYGAGGLPVGELQKILKIPSSTLSHHISSLISVGLITQIRKGTTLFCVGNGRLIKELSVFLIKECCIKSFDTDDKKGVNVPSQ